MLKEVRYRGIRVQYAPDIGINNPFDLTQAYSHLDLSIRAFRKQKSLLDQFGLDFSGKRKSTTLLFAHGCYLNGFWGYNDGEKKRSMREWIWNEEMASDLLLIFSCNPRNYEVSSRKAIVVHPTDYVRPLIAAYFGNPMRVYTPGEGYDRFSI